MDYFGKMLVYIGFEGRVFGQCHSKWIMSPNFLEVVCTIAVILYYYVDLTPLIDKKKIMPSPSIHCCLVQVKQI